MSFTCLQFDIFGYIRSLSKALAAAIMQFAKHMKQNLFFVLVGQFVSKQFESFLVEHISLSSNHRLPFVWSPSVGHRNACVIHALPFLSPRMIGSIIGAIKMGEEPKALFDHNISSDGKALGLAE